MLNILLPAYSRSYAALSRAGLITATDETENQELENLVLRERAVVWADLEEAGHPLQSEKTGDERQETGCTELQLAPILSFSQLLYHSNSPCSKFSCTSFISIVPLDCWVPSQRSFNKRQVIMWPVNHRHGQNFSNFTLNSHFHWIHLMY